MRKVYKLLLLAGVCAFLWQGFAPYASAQPAKSINWDFNNPAGSYGNWASILGGSFQFVKEDAVLKVPYNKKEWHFIQIWLGSFDFISAPVISFKVKSDSTISLHMVIKDRNENVLDEDIPLTAGADWTEVSFNYRFAFAPLDTVIQEIQFDPGWISAPDSLGGKLYFDDFKLGNAAIDEDILTMAPYAYVAPVIDGTVDGIWGQSLAVNETVAVGGAGTMDGAFASSFTTLWDEDALYVLVEVTDDTAWWSVGANGSLKQDHSDYVDLFVDYDKATPYTTTQANGSWWNYYDANDFQIKFLRDSAWIEIGGQFPGRSTDASGIEYSAGEVTGGWVLEAKIPWTKWASSWTWANSSSLGFEISVGDIDGSTEADTIRDGRVNWINPADNNWEDPRVWGVVELYNGGLPHESSFFEDFEAPVDMDFWHPSNAWNDAIDTFIFVVTQENGMLHTLERQVNFFDGQMYTFNDRLFDLTENPYASFRIKLDSGLFTDWQTLPLDYIPFQLGPWSIDNIRQHAVNLQVKPDGQWHTLYFDWSTAYTGGGDLSNIQKFLFESVSWPAGGKAYFWIDDFRIGEGVKYVTDLKSTFAYKMPVIDGTVDPVWQNLPGIEGDSILKISAGTMDEDFASTFKTLWDNDYLYVLVEVKDNVAFWNVDADEAIKQDHSDYIDLFIDLERDFPYKANKDNGSWWNTYDNTDYQLKFLRDSNWTEVGGQVPGRATAPFVDFKVAEVLDGTTLTGWVLEARIPWDSMGVITPANAKKIGFDITVGDADEAGADSTRKGRYSWVNPGDNNWENPSLWGILELTGAGKKINTLEFAESFENPVDLDWWRPNKSELDDGTDVFGVTQQDGALKIDMYQKSFPDGQMYTFTDYWFKLTNYPYASLKVKVDSALWTDWTGTTYTTTVPFQLGPWSPDGVRQHADSYDVPIDGEWHQLYYDWSTVYEDGGDLSLISKFLLESVSWPRADTAWFWLDDFFIGKKALKATKADTLSSLTVDPGTLVPVFAPKTKYYTVELPAGTTATPTTTAVAADVNSTVVIADAADVTSTVYADKTTIVTVTAQDWRVKRTYEITFNVITGVPELNAGDFMLYPNPADDVLYLTNAANLEVMTITNLLGQKVRTIQLSSADRHEIDITNLENGVYIINISDIDNNIYTRRIVIK